VNLGLGDILKEKTMEIRCEKTPWGDNIEVLASKHEGNQVFSAGSLVWTRLEEGAAFSEPTMKLKNHVAQQLMDELWRCGLRPSEGTGSAGSLAATERHLKDLQRLVFKPSAEGGLTA
jgi:hypothetical protein